MKSVAANRVIVDASTLLTNHYITLSDDGEVIEVAPLELCRVEPSMTRFYNGLITTDVSENKRVVGKEIKLLVSERLEKGYSGRLLLWKNLSLSELKITEHTVVDVL